MYRIARLNWKGEKPGNVKQVLWSKMDFSLVLYRTQLFGPSITDNVNNMQAGCDRFVMCLDGYV